MKTYFEARTLAKFGSNEKGAAASEYAIVLAFIAAAVATAAAQFDLTSVFPSIVAKIATLIG